MQIQVSSEELRRICRWKPAGRGTYIQHMSSLTKLQEELKMLGRVLAVCKKQ